MNSVVVRFLAITFSVTSIIHAAEQGPLASGDSTDSSPPSPNPGLIWVKAGKFTMGSPHQEKGRDLDEDPLTEVTFPRGFWVGKFEVTQQEYETVTGSNPSSFRGDANRPVESVTWGDAVSYCAKLTSQERAAGRLPSGYAYRLPTEAEFEYACRAGTSTRFSYGDDPNFDQLGEYAWYMDNSGGTAHPVGKKLPNAFGLHDMHGNVWEWCWDWYGDRYSGGSVTDPLGAVSGTGRVFRGGGWDYRNNTCRSAFRNHADPSRQFAYVGFRVVLSSVLVDLPAEITTGIVTTGITWPAPANITFNTLLSSAQLNATVNVEGSFSYTPPAGTKLAAGTHSLRVTFTPANAQANSGTMTLTNTITVKKATPQITWNQPADITPGTRLGAAQLNATADVPGIFIYSPEAGTILSAGVGQKLALVFYPTDVANYEPAKASATIDVTVPGLLSVITDQPVSATATNGATVRFTVTAVGATRYQWQKDGANIPGAMSASLTLLNVAAAHAGKYTVIVSNPLSSVTSAAAALTILAASLAPAHGDFDGDGEPDLIFQDSGGFVAAWLMGGSTLNSARFLNPSHVGDTNYRIAGSGDFNGDGMEDLLFQHNDGTLAVWHMRGTTNAAAALLNPSNPGDRNWRAVRAADMNKDGKQDLVFQHTDGTLAVWHMDGVKLTSAALFEPRDPGDRRWQVSGIGDLNADGSQDLVFQHTDGTLAVWFLNGIRLIQAALLSPSHPGDAKWRVASVIDRNRDGKPDLLLQHADGAMGLWFMNGHTQTGAQMLNPHPGETWRVVAP